MPAGELHHRSIISTCKATHHGSLSLRESHRAQRHATRSLHEDLGGSSQHQWVGTSGRLSLQEGSSEEHWNFGRFKLILFLTAAAASGLNQTTGSRNFSNQT